MTSPRGSRTLESTSMLGFASPFSMALKVRRLTPDISARSAWEIFSCLRLLAICFPRFDMSDSLLVVKLCDILLVFVLKYNFYGGMSIEYAKYCVFWCFFVRGAERMPASAQHENSQAVLLLSPCVSLRGPVRGRSSL